MEFENYSDFGISLSYQIKLLCEDFASKCIETNINFYNNRKQTNRKKIFNDILIGKLGEFFTYFYLKSLKLNPSIPDLSIYINNKSFSPDIVTDSFNFHIKTQSSYSIEKYGISWIFQKEDPLLTNYNKDDYFIGLTESINCFKIELIKPVSELKFAEPRLNKFNGIKSAIYLKDNK